jgi:ABC-type Na+ efflux pump permease subunit
MKQCFGKGLVILGYVLVSLIALVWIYIIITKTYAGFVEDGIWGAFMSFTFWLFIGGFGAFLIAVIISLPFYLLGGYLLKTDTKDALR